MSLQSLLPDFDASGMRPVLLAGAIGLFAAWLVSGMNARSGSRGRQGRQAYRPEYQPGRGSAERDGFRQNRPQQTRGPTSGYSSVGPEGQGSREDFAFDAMNP
jgi:hypothetical protein